jgi:hypothetical protein
MAITDPDGLVITWEELAEQLKDGVAVLEEHEEEE